MTSVEKIPGDKSIPQGMGPTTESNDELSTNPVQVIWDVIFFFLKLFWYVLEGIFKLFVPVAEKSVKGEIVLVTGAGHGIGRQLAFQYASQGAIVVCWDIHEKNNQETVKDILKMGNAKAYGYICDVSRRENVLEVAQKVRTEVGDVSILINNAGVMPCHPFLDHTTQEIERIININVMAHFWTLQAFLPKMIENNHGHIVALSSCAGLAGLRNLVPYCASKFAVRGMMEALSQELRVNTKNNIKLTCIYPYMVDTGLCVRPKIRFANMMPLLKQDEVAKYIMSAQRRDIGETTIPRSLLSLNYYVRLFPMKVGMALSDLLKSYVDSDL